MRSYRNISLPVYGQEPFRYFSHLAQSLGDEIFDIRIEEINCPRVANWPNQDVWLKGLRADVTGRAPWDASRIFVANGYPKFFNEDEEQSVDRAGEYELRGDGTSSGIGDNPVDRLMNATISLPLADALYACGMTQVGCAPGVILVSRDDFDNGDLYETITYGTRLVQLLDVVFERSNKGDILLCAGFVTLTHAKEANRTIKKRDRSPAASQESRDNGP